MDSNTNKLLYLFEEIKSKIIYLEDALDEINQVKKSLKVTSVDVKAQIRDSISRHLEALRNREIWLLSQVELVLHGKEDVLSQKQGELLEVVGGMKKVCELLDQSTGVECLEVFEDQLSALITSVEKLNVSPEESPGIAFTGQNLDLLESIRSFGKVDHSKDESNIASLLNKMDLSDQLGNKRKFITEATPIENWLLNGKRCQESSVSVEKWLTKCKAYSDVQSEMNYSEMSDAIDNRWLLSLEKNQLKQEVKMAYFNEIKMSSPSKWIRKSPKAPVLPTTVVSETYSKIASLGNEYWLMYKQERSKQNSLPVDLGKIHSMEDYSKWLRNSTTSKLPETSTGKAYSALAASSIKRWLKPKTVSACSGKGDCSDCDQWLLNSSSKSNRSDDLESLADSDWLKVKDLDVLSIENLDSMFSDCCNTNDQCNIKQEDKSGVEKYNLMLQSQPNENWLQRSLSSNHPREARQSTDSMRVFEEYLTSNDYNKWLVRPTGVSSDVCKWLARSSLERCKNCPETCSKGLFKLFGEVKDTSSDIWLKN